MPGKDVTTASFAARLPARHDTVIDLGRRVDQFLHEHRITDRPQYVAHLVLEELLTNAIRHGGGTDEKSVNVEWEMEIEPDRLVIRIADDGVAFDPRHVDAPEIHRPLAERQGRGVGLHLVREMASAVDYEHRDGRNHVTVEIQR